MRVLIDILHPAHLHRFKHYLWKAQEEGDELCIVARNKEVVKILLDSYNFSYIDTGPLGEGFFGKFSELKNRTSKILSIAKEFKPDVLVGGDGYSVGPVGKILGKPSISVSDTEDQGLISNVAYYLTSYVLTPTTFKKDFGKRHIRFSGFYEMTYLSPEYFTPEPEEDIYTQLGIPLGTPYFILRLVSWKSVHDKKEEGLDIEKQRKIISEMQKYGKVFISAEGDVPQEFASLAIYPTNIHSVLYYAQLYFGDSQTMSIEAGLLGVPAIRCNSLVNKLHAKGQFDAFHNVYEIVYSYNDFKEAFSKLQELLEEKDRKEIWKKKRGRVLAETEDFTKYFYALLHTKFDPFILNQK